MTHFRGFVRALAHRFFAHRRARLVRTPVPENASAPPPFPWNVGTPPLVSPVLADPAAADQPFMPYSTCSAADFFHPRFLEISDLLNSPVALHRKYWEWVYIVHTALDRGLAAPGKRALGFGVGQEAIPAVLAKLGTEVTATVPPRKSVSVKGGIAAANMPEMRSNSRTKGLSTRNFFCVMCGTFRST